MSFMGLNGSTGSATNFWNFSNKEKPNYSTELIGYVIELQSVPKTVFGSNKIDRFDDGNCKRNIRLIILTDDGTEIAWDFNPGGRDKSAAGGEDKRSQAMKALANGIVAAVPQATDIEDILGMRVRVSTKEPPEGWSWSNTNPRPWNVAFDPKRRVEHRGCVIKPDWEREGGEVDAPPNEPAQVGTANPQLNASMAAAGAAIAANNVSNRMGLGQDEMPPVSVYDEDISF